MAGSWSITPNGTTARPQPRIESALVKALARAHRWRRMLESGEYSSLTGLAAARKFNLWYMSRVVRLTLIAPDIVAALLDGRQPGDMTLPPLMRLFPVD